MEEFFLGLPKEILEGGVVVTFTALVFVLLFRFLTGKDKTQDGHFSAIIEILTSLVTRFTVALDRMTGTMVELKEYLIESRTSYQNSLEDLKIQISHINHKLDALAGDREN